MPRNFDNWLSAYMRYTSDSEAPDDFHFWTGVSTIAGALRRRVWLDMRKFQWTSNFYIILVAPPGIATKSTSVRTGMALLERIEGVKFGPPSMTWQALTEGLSDAFEYVTIPGREDDPVPMSCLTIPVSELGTLLKFEDSALVDVLVDLWDGQLASWGHKTKTSGETEIKNPWLNIIGCTTPSWLRAHFPEHQIGGGFTSRIIFVWGDKKRSLIPYPDEHTPDKEYYMMQEQLVSDLEQIGSLCGTMTLSKEAREWGHKWYNDHWTGDRPVHLASDRYGGYISRKQTHMHKLAMVLSAARDSSLIIDKEHLIEADNLLNTVEPHMLKVFESVGLVNEARHVAELIPFVKAYEFLSSDDLYRKVVNLMSQREFAEALNAGVRAKMLVVERKEGQLGVVLGPVT